MQNSLLQCIECSYDEVHFLGNSNYISKWAHFNTCSKLILLYLKKSKFYSPIPPWIMNLAIHEIQNPFSLFSLICEHMFIFFTVFFPPIKTLVFKNQDCLLKLNCPCNLRANKSFLNFHNLKVLPKILKIHLNYPRKRILKIKLNCLQIISNWHTN